MPKSVSGYHPICFNFFIMLENVKASVKIWPTKPCKCIMQDKTDNTFPWD